MEYAQLKAGDWIAAMTYSEGDMDLANAHLISSMTKKSLHEIGDMDVDVFEPLEEEVDRQIADNNPIHETSDLGRQVKLKVPLTAGGVEITRVSLRRIKHRDKYNPEGLSPARKAYKLVVALTGWENRTFLVDALSLGDYLQVLSAARSYEKKFSIEVIPYDSTTVSDDDDVKDQFADVD